ncbi:cytochrome P450 2L1-like [Panulirus ornatus]|uniref:cytochrome P450 2L1-like n=1 Tax=Panulirus ornatus TaxID=150431 RepID=UPI003A86CA97
MAVEVVVVAVVTLLLLLMSFLKKPAGLPPGRWGLPGIGYPPINRRPLDDQLAELHRQHGDIYLWRIGTQVMVFLHNYKLTREAFSRPEFINRPDWRIFKRLVYECNAGVVGSEGQVWQNNRRFTIRQLRDLGMGKSRMVSVVQQEARFLVEALQKQTGRPAPVPHALTVSTVNVLWQMVASKRFHVDDPVVFELEKLIDDTLANMTLISLPDFLPWLSMLLPWALQKRLFNLDIVDAMRERFSKFCVKLIEDHLATLDRERPRDLIDAYLLNMNENDCNSSASMTDLSKMIFDMFTAGSETTTNTLTWLFYFLATYPEVQRKLQAEVDRVLPRGTLATLEDRPRLPYTEAVIHEVHRKASVTSMGVQHAAVQETLLGDYLIPKGAVIISAVASMHHDPRYWDHPDQFLPDRWLDHNGNFNTQKEGFLPFGVGKRRCVAEALVRMELLIFTSALVQTLHFSPPPGRKLDMRHDSRNPFSHLALQQDLLITVRD